MNLQYDIEPGKPQAEELTATIGEAASDMEAIDEKIKESSAPIAPTFKEGKAETWWKKITELVADEAKFQVT